MSRTLVSRKGPGLRPPQRPPDDTFFARQLDALRRHRSKINVILGEAKQREAAIEAEFAAEAEKVRDLFGPSAGARAEADAKSRRPDA